VTDDGRYWPVGDFIKWDDGMFSIKVKVSGMIATMNPIWESESPAIDALASRCVPYIWTVSDEDSVRTMRGVKTVHKGIVIPKKMVDVTISRMDYEFILMHVLKSGVSKNLLARTVCDCCRAFAALGSRHSIYVYNLIIGCKKGFEAKRVDYLKSIGIKDPHKRWLGKGYRKGKEVTYTEDENE